MKSKAEPENKAYIWGAAQYGAYALEYCKDRFSVEGFVDRRADEMFGAFCQKLVVPPEHFLKMADAHTNLIIAVKYPVDVWDRLIAEDPYADVRPVWFFDGRNPDVPFLYRVEDGEICVPQYMDKEFSEWKDYAVHYSKLDSHIVRLFTAAFSGGVKLEGNSKICEIGCGSGQFANMLFDNGIEDYIGVDFSSRAIALAQSANPGHAHQFLCCDAFSYLTSDKGQDADVFVLFEVLEHIKRDRDLLRLLPLGKRVIFSVPNFKSFNHIRIFNDLESIQRRYDMLEILGYQELTASTVYPDKKYHLVFAKTLEKEQEG